MQDQDDDSDSYGDEYSSSYINLDGFLLTGNPCNTRKDKDSPWHWANTAEEGAIALNKNAAGIYSCTFRADNNDTILRLFKGDWETEYGLTAIDTQNSSLPNGVRITNDTEIVNNTPELEKYQNPNNIGIAGLEAKRKYNITFNTKKSPGKICIELTPYKISSLDGYMITGTPVENDSKWPGNREDGALPLQKNGSSWTVTFMAKKGWNGFRLIKEEWKDELGWSQLAFTPGSNSYSELTGGFDYALEDDDNIAFKDDFDGSEEVTLTFGIKEGLITIDTHIDYNKQFEVNGLYFVQDGGKPQLITDEKISFTCINKFENTCQIHLLVKTSEKPPAGGNLQGNYYYYENGCCWYDDDGNYYYFRSFSRYDSSRDKLPSGVSINYDSSPYFIHIIGLTNGKKYILKFDTTSQTGYFSLIITEN